MERDADPNLGYYRQVYGELQKAVVGMQRELVALRSRVLRSRCEGEDVGVTTSDDDGQW